MHTLLRMMSCCSIWSLSRSSRLWQHCLWQLRLTICCVLLCCAAVQWAALEGASRSLAFTSGMAALAVATKLVPAGGHIVAGDDLYGGTSRLLSRVVPNNGVTVSNVDLTDLG